MARLDPEQFGGVAAVGHREDPGGVALQQQARVEPTHATASALYRISRTFSCGRHRRTPLSVSTSGRLIRIGCSTIASRMASSDASGAVSPSSSASGSFARRPSRGEMPARAYSRLSSSRPGGFFEIFVDGHVRAGFAQDFQGLARGAASRIVMDQGFHRRRSFSG